MKMITHRVSGSTTPGLALSLFFTLAIQLGGPVHAQSDFTETQPSAIESRAEIATKEVVETAVKDIGFLLTLHDNPSRNTPLIQQLKEDYYPLFQHKIIARQVLESRFQNTTHTSREYLECLVGLTFFNAHLDIVSRQNGEQKLFEITNAEPLTNSGRLWRVDIEMTQEGGIAVFSYRLINRGENSDWKIVDIRSGTNGLLSTLKSGLKQVNNAVIAQDTDAYKQLTQYLIRQNQSSLISADQWCTPAAEAPDAPEPEPASEPVERELVEARTTINGEVQNITLEVTPDGSIVYQDDIILRSDGNTTAALSGLDFSKLRLWSDAIVPYVIDNTVSDRAMILSAIKEWDTKTPVRFIEAGVEDNNYLIFTTGEGCRSSLGMIQGRQFITLGNRCSYGTVLHEIGHTLGLIHEHTRNIRDEHINVKLRNVLYEKEHNFQKHPPGHPVSDSYCYGSIMHYSEHAFAITHELKTIEVKGNKKIGQRTHLSVCDITRVGKLYSPLAKSSKKR